VGAQSGARAIDARHGQEGVGRVGQLLVLNTHPCLQWLVPTRPLSMHHHRKPPTPVSGSEGTKGL
jgi:hypothetical protein